MMTPEFSREAAAAVNSGLFLAMPFSERERLRGAIMSSESSDDLSDRDRRLFDRLLEWER